MGDTSREAVVDSLLYDRYRRRYYPIDGRGVLGEVQSQAPPHLFSERSGLAGAVPRALLLGTEDKSEDIVLPSTLLCG